MGTQVRTGRTEPSGIKEGDSFELRLTPLRPVQDEEWALLDATILLVTRFGAMGGRTVLKPSDEDGRSNRKQHEDYGLVAIAPDTSIETPDRHRLTQYVRRPGWFRPGHGEFVWVSLQNFWFVDGQHLSRQGPTKSTYNRVLGIGEGKGKDHRKDQLVEWLAGDWGISKKVFSFKSPARTFGFVRPGLLDFDQMGKRLELAWEDGDWAFMDGEQVMDQLFAREEVCR